MSAKDSLVHILQLPFKVIKQQRCILYHGNCPLCRALYLNVWILNKPCGHSTILLVVKERLMTHVDSLQALVRIFFSMKACYNPEILWFWRSVKLKKKYIERALKINFEKKMVCLLLQIKKNLKNNQWLKDIFLPFAVN